MEHKKKRRIGLVVDDICSLPNKIIQKHPIEIVRTKLFFPEAERFPEKNLYQVMDKTKNSPKTSAPSPGDFVNAYRRLLKRVQKIIVITLSSYLSGTYNSAFQAKELMPDSSIIELIDSEHAVAGEGLFVLKALELIKAGRRTGHIKNVLKEIKHKIKMVSFLKNTLWAERIGRVSKRQGWVFHSLKSLGVQPVIGIKRGVIGFTGLNFWTRDVLKAMFCQLKHRARTVKRHYRTNIRVGINYTDNIKIAYNLRNKLERELSAEIAFVSLVPPIVGANSGPGTLIVAYHPIMKIQTL